MSTIGTPDGLTPATSQTPTSEPPSTFKLHRDGRVSLDGDVIGWVDHYRCRPKSTWRAVMQGGIERRGFRTAADGARWLVSGGIG